MGWRFEVFDSIGSTSDLCKARAEEGAPAGLAVQALEQSAGRGRRGRRWEGGKGNLAVSFLLRPTSYEAFLGAAPFLSSLALFDAALRFLPPEFACEGGTDRLMLKWPNDLLLDGRKMAGILIETGGREGERWVVIGMGANLLFAPDVPGRALAAFSEIAPPPDPRAFGAVLAEALERRTAGWERHGFAPVRADWLKRAHPAGTRLAVAGPLAGGEAEPYITGSFSGLDERGRLLLALPGGEILPVVTGDIMLD